jgi:hypothetical protein
MARRDASKKTALVPGAMLRYARIPYRRIYEGTNA